MLYFRSLLSLFLFILYLFLSLYYIYFYFFRSLFLVLGSEFPNFEVRNIAVKSYLKSTVRAYQNSFGVITNCSPQYSSICTSHKQSYFLNEKTLRVFYSVSILFITAWLTAYQKQLDLADNLQCVSKKTKPFQIQISYNYVL